jgi:hypothetical protein
VVGVEVGSNAEGQDLAVAGLGGPGEHAPWMGGPRCLEVSHPWRVAAGRDEGVESERRGKRTAAAGYTLGD